MISAMPAVALRWERRRSQARSRANSILPGERRFSGTDFQLKPDDEMFRRSSVLTNEIDIERNDYELKRRKSFLLQIGMICLTTGAVVLLLAVSLGIDSLLPISLVVIGMGCLICLFRLFLGFDDTPGSGLPDYDACRVRKKGSSKKGSTRSRASVAHAELARRKSSSIPTDALEELRVNALHVPQSRRSSSREVGKNEWTTGDDSLSLLPSKRATVPSRRYPLSHTRRVSSGDSGVDFAPT